MILDEIPSKHSLCPNTTEFMIEGEMIGPTYFMLRIMAKEKALQLQYPGIVVTHTMKRDFNPDFYEKNGFLKPVADRVD